MVTDNLLNWLTPWWPELWPWLLIGYVLALVFVRPVRKLTMIALKVSLIVVGVYLIVGWIFEALSIGGRGGISFDDD